MSEKTVRIGFIGTGLRGQWLLDIAADNCDMEIPAICDIDDHMLSLPKEILKKKAGRSPGCIIKVRKISETCWN